MGSHEEVFLGIGGSSASAADPRVLGLVFNSPFWLYYLATEEGSRVNSRK